MKSALPLLAILALPALASAQQRPGGGGMGEEVIPKNRPAPASVVATDAQLLAAQKAQKFGGLAPKGQKQETWDLDANSSFIKYDGAVTLVPKGAILFVPDRFKDAVVTGISGKFSLWNEFSTKYRGLVTPFEVTVEQASGAKPIEEERLAAARRSGLILVAVFNGNPISVQSIAPAATTAP
ncbi:hypothetical protein OVA24_03895 [Luteolibacter sp. SL250]|uniref:hypothetical protein n=1 Tax=Luteolibacter sp. SL250 TaxID=2995170 RepID=UPI00226D6FD3|nr:hypothetical protein [Luteolibacter sp. SL250]WAC20520.1 hypothetical protein OVA24_03895 [Luteolibacter sp. SL250]